jgi:peptidoglycan hydrolase-like protein with peptidoglycan-binding domain
VLAPPPQPAHVATVPAVTAPAHTPTASPVPTPTPTTPSPAAAAPAPGGGLPGGKLTLTLQRVGGEPLFALLGQRIVVRGTVSPYVAGQQVQVSFYLDGRKVLVKGASIAAMGNGVGQFHVSFASANGGLVEARASHPATAAQGSFSGVSPKVRYVSDAIGPGAAGQSVRLLQSELAGLHYAVPLSGVFEEGTGRALIAYRKMTNLARVGLAGRQVFAKLAQGEGAFHVRYRGDGRHVEANLAKQVLAEIEPGGQVHAIYTMSSGKPSTPTVLGRFRVYSKTPGTNSEGMVDANYFIRGYAIHGYAEVPTYAASHGCLRVPIPDAPAIYGWVRTGTPVDVYN